MDRDDAIADFGGIGPVTMPFFSIKARFPTLLCQSSVINCSPVTAIVAPGGWATAKRPFSDFVATRVLPRNRNPFLQKLELCRRPGVRAREVFTGRALS